MFRRNKGQISILAGLGIIAAVIIYGGFTAGNIQEGFQMFINNWTTVFVAALGLSLTVMVAYNSTQPPEKANWKTELAGVGVVLGIVLIAPYAVNAATPQKLYQADMRVVVTNPPLRPMSILYFDRGDITNFREWNPASVYLPEDRSLSIIYDKGSLSWKVKCSTEEEEEVVDKGSADLHVREASNAAVERVIDHLPSGGNCKVEATLYNKNDKKLDSKTVSFMVPG